MTTPTMFLPMSCTSPFTVASTMVGSGFLCCDFSNRIGIGLQCFPMRRGASFGLRLSSPLP